MDQGTTPPAPRAIPTPRNAVPTPLATHSVAPVEVTGAESIVRSLVDVYVKVMIGIPSAAILPTYDALMYSKRLRHILMRHEHDAGHAAEGYASATVIVGVSIASSGPLATNLV